MRESGLKWRSAALLRGNTVGVISGLLRQRHAYYGRDNCQSAEADMSGGTRLPTKWLKRGDSGVKILKDLLGNPEGAQATKEWEMGDGSNRTCPH
jgi:hypothetical protein